MIKMNKINFLSKIICVISSILFVICYFYIVLTVPNTHYSKIILTLLIAIVLINDMVLLRWDKYASKESIIVQILFPIIYNILGITATYIFMYNI